MSDVTAQQVLSASAVKTAQFPLAFDSRLSIEVLQVIIGRGYTPCAVFSSVNIDTSMVTAGRLLGRREKGEVGGSDITYVKQRV